MALKKKNKPKSNEVIEAIIFNSFLNFNKPVPKPGIIKIVVEIKKPKKYTSP